MDSWLILVLVLSYGFVNTAQAWSGHAVTLYSLATSLFFSAATTSSISDSESPLLLDAWFWVKLAIPPGLLIAAPIHTLLGQRGFPWELSILGLLLSTFVMCATTLLINSEHTTTEVSVAWILFAVGVAIDVYTAHAAI